ncbi:60S ribosomal protein L6, mitochondrial [Glycine soja]|uniref:60S ribosomal protein L6, mitochondrial n=2 Tax=Glycine soja TaxID=3848 RepID=A0A445F7I1_GLYSO|nr:60S ribosomal protein L6, mitochondrial [Glycine soja]
MWHFLPIMNSGHLLLAATVPVTSLCNLNFVGVIGPLHCSNIFALELMETKFFRFLKIVGVGYKARAEAAGRLLYLKLGYSHDVELAVPPAVRVFCFKNNVICCTGIDKQRVHQFAATVRTCKPPEVYKGKGIMYVDEVIKKKQGKKSK